MGIAISITRDRAMLMCCTFASKKSKNIASKAAGIAPAKNHVGIVERYASKNEFTQPTCCNVGGECSHPNIDNRCCANASQYNRHRQGYFNFKKNLPIVHTHAAGSICNGCIYLRYTRVGIAYYGQQSIQHQRYNSRFGTNA